MAVVSILVSGLVVLLTLIVTYILYMSRKFGTFKKMGIPHIKPWPVIGNIPEITKIGFMNFIRQTYNERFANEKVYGYYEPGGANLVIRDLDMIRDICIKNFNFFLNRRHFVDEEPFNSMMTVLKGDHWRRVRNTVSPTFSSGKLKRMTPLIEQTTHNLLANLRELNEKDEAVELRQILSCFTMDVIASSGFGVEVNSLKDKKSPFVTGAREILDTFMGIVGFFMFFPFMRKIYAMVGKSVFSKKTINFFGKFVDEVLATRREGGKSTTRTDFVQLLVNADNSTSEFTPQPEFGTENVEKKELTQKEIQAQSLIFILAGYDTVSVVFSFSLFLLANHPEYCEKVQKEVDQILDGRFPTYESVQEMTYLDMCLNEAMRMFPPGFVIDRVCTENCVVQGVKIPKDTVVMFPVLGIHYDPNIWDEPEKFDPERFSASNKSSRHPFSHLPFGQGPRNCIGMRLALLEIKIAMAAILQEMTPVPCEKSVYPIKLHPYKIVAVDDLWVKMVPRN